MKNQFKFNVSLLFILYLLTACEQERVLEQTGAISKIQIEAFNETLTEYELQLHEDHFELSTTDGKETRLYQTVILDKGTGKQKEDLYFEWYLLATDNSDYKMLKATPNDLGGKFTLAQETNTFNGTVLEYTKEGEMESLKTYENGILQTEATLAELDQKGNLSGREYWEPLKNWDYPGTNGGGRVSIFVERYTDIYLDRNSNGAAEASEYAYTRYNGGGWEYVEYGDQEYLPITNNSFHRHNWSNGVSSTRITHYEETLSEYPSCESFDYYKVGNTGVQVAGVNGIWDVVTKWGRCPGIGVAASYQTYYFQVPAWWNAGLAAEKSASALSGAFYDLQKWFEKQPCSQVMTGVLAVKMDEFIKENFREIGGQATRTAPLGWQGTVQEYIEDWRRMDNCY
tara:strand:- start:27 stop:1223 length:1197 start_codon:yes stop_codon:yes gene_type:complete